MTGKALAAIALRVWGVILIVGALASSPSTILFVTLAPAVGPEASVFRVSQIGVALTLLVHAALGVALVLLADRIVGWVTPDGPPLRIDVYASELAALGFALVGLYALVQGAENIAAAVYTVATKPWWPASSDSTFWYVWEHQREAIVRAFVQIAAGAVLMFGRRAIVNAWWWLRGEPAGGESA
jgi:hypothetical protein